MSGRVEKNSRGQMFLWKKVSVRKLDDKTVPVEEQPVVVTESYQCVNCLGEVVEIEDRVKEALEAHTCG